MEWKSEEFRTEKIPGEEEKSLVAKELNYYIAEEQSEKKKAALKQQQICHQEKNCFFEVCLNFLKPKIKKV